MPDKSDNSGQPSIEKLTAEGVSLRKCIGMGESYGNGGGSSSKAPAKPKGALAGMKMKKGGY